MEKVRPWCGQPSDRGRLKNRTGTLSPVVSKVFEHCVLQKYGDMLYSDTMQFGFKNILAVHMHSLLCHKLLITFYVMVTVTGLDYRRG